MNYKWVIDKEFRFEAGHRVWSQHLDRPDLSIDTYPKCRHLHGHSYVIKVSLGSNELDYTGMVLDFKNLNFVKKFVDDVLDHKFIIDVNDPLFATITGIKLPNVYITNLIPFTNLSDICKDNQLFIDYNTEDFINSFVLVDFVPTSENICKALKEYVQSQINKLADVVSIDLWETQKSHCRYTG